MTMMHGALDFPPDVLAQKGRGTAVAEHRGVLVRFLQAKLEPRMWEESLASEAPVPKDRSTTPHAG
jgi:hypothetical protein